MNRVGTLWRLVLGAALLASSSIPSAGAAGPCDGAEHRQFDFWLGEWTVSNPDGSAAGTSSITRELDGCVIHERWSGLGGLNGQSFNLYDPATKGWHQIWVDDTGRGPATLEGGWDGERMVLSGVRAGPRGTRHSRITWSRLEGAGVRQLVEMSQDGGATWAVVFDGRYRPK